MSLLGSTPTPKASCSAMWLSCGSFILFFLTTCARIGPPVPQSVQLSHDYEAQKLSISWHGGDTSTFDVLIRRTVFNQTVFFDTITAKVNQKTGFHEWSWTSEVPLECASLSVQVRSRYEKFVSGWSEVQILPEKPIPAKREAAVYPQDRVVLVGSNITLCCMVAETATFEEFSMAMTKMNETLIAPRTYAATHFYDKLSRTDGDNFFCMLKDRNMWSYGSCAFSGYPPSPADFYCETRDLMSAVCWWDRGPTNLYGNRGSKFTVNNRNCSGFPWQEQRTCTLPQWDGIWTLDAVNPVGRNSLTYSAEISHRVHPVAPTNLSIIDYAWNATLQWQWTYETYYSFDLDCKVDIGGECLNAIFRISGVGLHSMDLLGLRPGQHYDVRVRCAANKHFWKWGDWSELLSFETREDVPDAPDVWMRMNRDNTGLVLWKPLTCQQRHGRALAFEVTLWSTQNNVQHTFTLSPKNYSQKINLGQMGYHADDKGVMASVVVKNRKGQSPTATVLLRSTEEQLPDWSKVVSTNGSFFLSWHKENTSCDYLVEWVTASCEHDCPVEWLRMADGNTSVSIKSENFSPGLRYNFTLYGCPSGSLQRIKQWQGYSQQLIPSNSGELGIMNQGTDAVLTWEDIPLTDRRGFILGYNVYIYNSSHLDLLANLTDSNIRKYTVKGLPAGSYKFTLKAYTSAGEGTGSTASVTLEPRADRLILEMLAALGVMILILLITTFICYKKRKWVKKAFYPDIPEPKVPGDWSRTQGPLNITPAPHSMVQIVEKSDREFGKEPLVVIPEEDEDFEKEEAVDTDEPMALRYYNQVVGERPMRQRFPDSSTSSASSFDSGHTDVTYTGIQTSSSSLVFQQNSQSSPEDQQPGVVSFEEGAGGYRPQMHLKVFIDGTERDPSNVFQQPGAPSPVGYKPQASWHLESPTGATELGSLTPSLGSPISVASTQFLLPDGKGDENATSSSSWFGNLLSSSKP